MAAAVRIDLPPGEPTAALASALRDEQGLLVLDNCEHRIDEAAALVMALPAGARKLHVLATSLEALRVAGEMHLSPGCARMSDGRRDARRGGAQRGVCPPGSACARGRSPLQHRLAQPGAGAKKKRAEEKTSRGDAQVNALLGDWTDWVRCPKGQVAVGLRAYFEREGNNPRSVTGLGLWCRPVE